MPSLRIQAGLWQNQNLNSILLKPNPKDFNSYFGNFHRGHDIKRNRSIMKDLGLMFQEYWTAKCSSRDKLSSNWCCNDTELLCCWLLEPYVFISYPEVKGFMPGPPLAHSIRSFTPEQITAGWHHPNKQTRKVSPQPLMSIEATRVVRVVFQPLSWLCYGVFQHNNLLFSYVSSVCIH